MPTRIRLRRDTTSNWASEDPVLAQGEPGLDTDARLLKVGDGTSPWSALSGVYFDGTTGGGEGGDHPDLAAHNTLGLATQTELDAEAAARVAADLLLIPLTQKGTNNGVATLDGSGTIPDAQIPSSIARDSELGGGGGFTQEQIEDFVAALIIDGDGLDKAYDDTSTPATLTLSLEPEAVNTVAASGAAISHDVSAYAFLDATVTGNVTVSFTNVPAAPDTCTVVSFFTGDGTNRTVTLPDGFSFGLKSDDQSRMVLSWTKDGGTTWRHYPGPEKNTFDSIVEPNVQTGTAYTLARSDVGRAVHMSNASANVLTIPTNASVPLPVGIIIPIAQMGAGQMSVAPEDGTVTLNSKDNNRKINGQYVGATLHQVAANSWFLVGDLTA